GKNRASIAAAQHRAGRGKKGTVMAGNRRNPWYRSSATWFAALMVAAACGAAWYTSARNPTQPPSGPSTTMAANSPRGTAAPATTGHLDIGGLPTRVVVADAGIDAS